MHHVLTVWSWASSSTSLGLSFYVCKARITFSCIDSVWEGFSTVVGIVWIQVSGNILLWLLL